MELSEESFEKLRLDVEQLQSELDKQNTVRVVNTKWMIIVGAVLLSALGFTSFVQVPREADRAAREHVGEDVKAKAERILIGLEEMHANVGKMYASLGPLVANLPIGTVVPSMLAPKEFVKYVGDPDVFDSKISQWAPADGRLVAGSRYGSDVEEVVPDLRGVFIRGLNYTDPDKDISEDKEKIKWADPDGERKVGSLQEDRFGVHDHSVTLVAHYRSFQGDSAKDNPLKDEKVDNKDWNFTVKTTAVGNKETRPKNAALFFYIRIN